MDQWLGASFQLDSSRARARVGASLSEIRWPDVKRVIIGKKTIRLSPLDKASRMDSFRGVLLRTEPQIHARVLEFVRQHSSQQVVQETAQAEEN